MSYLQKYVSEKAKDRNVKAFNMITNKNEAKTIQKCISCNCKCKFKKQHVIQNKYGMMKHIKKNIEMVVKEKGLQFESQHKYL